jgi:small subunit ribosomal protein S14
MAKASIIQRAKKRELLIAKHLKKRNKLKNELKKAITYNAKLKISSELQKLPKNSSPTRIQNRC